MTEQDPKSQLSHLSRPDHALVHVIPHAASASLNAPAGRAVNQPPTSNPSLSPIPSLDRAVAVRPRRRTNSEYGDTGSLQDGYSTGYLYLLRPMPATTEGQNKDRMCAMRPDHGRYTISSPLSTASRHRSTTASCESPYVLGSATRTFPPSTADWKKVSPRTVEGRTHVKVMNGFSMARDRYRASEAAFEAL